MSTETSKVEEKVENVVETTETSIVKKVSRRGISSATGTTRLKFATSDANPNNGLFLAHLDSIEVKEITIGADSKGLASFAGHNIPKIIFTFASNEDVASKRKYRNLEFTAVESNVETIPGGKNEWQVNRILDYFKHIIDVFVLKGKQLTPEQEEALCLTHEDFDEEGNYLNIETEEVIESWKLLFSNMANILNNNDAPYYKTKDGKLIPVWIKLIRHYKRFDNKTKSSVWVANDKGDLSFSNMVGEGVIELFSPNQKSSIKLDMVKESIIIRKDDTPAKQPNIIGSNIPVGAGAFIDQGITSNDMSGGMPMGDINEIGVGIGDDMPF